MLLFAVCFVVYALNHPEASFSPNSMLLIYGSYTVCFVIMTVLFVAPFKKR